MINITFPDGNIRQYESGTSALDIAKSISMGLANKVLVAKVNGEVRDLMRPIDTDASLELLTWDSEDGKKTYWHSSAHLLAEALEALYPGTKFGIGPAIDAGFYYDVDMGEKSLSTNDFAKIEEKMLELARKKSQYTRKEVSKADAIQYFTEKGDEYKLELLEGLNDGDITFYTQGDFTDLCRGPHIPNTEGIKAIKLMKVAGAYWRGDESRKQMTRIYGITFPKAQDLKDHLTMIEEALKRDHRKLGQELELFMFSEKVGAGLPIWLPRGTALRSRLEDFLKKEQIKRGYQPVITPHIANKKLYETSGHWAKYGADSFQPIQTPREGEVFLLKPMNCPHHCEIYGHRPRSYKELPLRIAEFGTVYRYEQAGELHGLTRVRGFTQDDAHLFCTPDQLESEFIGVVELTTYVLKKMGFENYTAQISLRHQTDRSKYIGSEELWEQAENAIIEATKKIGLKTTIEYDEAAFYGPKLDFMVKDALGRSWQLGTVQVDYNLPNRFELEYIGADNQPHRPVMIHRAPFGSMERFIGVLTEHCAGKFPLWMTPDQVAILPISDRFSDYANGVLDQLAEHDIRGFVDERAEKIGRKIRDTELKRVPFMLIVGEKEVAEGRISVRKQGGGDKEEDKGKGDMGSMTIAEFVAYFKNLIQ
ncbi:MAG: threonine--tRNA ligase [Saprospiraceae bacterium]|nr:threonine--tRNA ligase [Saprospiraceae bacterium]